jgi:hypothetical protein
MYVNISIRKTLNQQVQNVTKKADYCELKY